MGLSLGSSEMKVTVVSRSGKQLAVLDTLNPNSTIKEVQKELALSKASFPVERQRLTLQNKDDKARPVALDADKKLSDYGLTTDCTIIFKDLGPQISWRTVFALEYLGPMLLYPIFYSQPWWIYGSDLPAMDLVQHLAFACFMLHYLKREYETVFVHRFGNGTMPLRNLFKNSSYYWGNALICAYFINRPGYTPPSFLLVVVGVALFVIGEVGNFLRIKFFAICVALALVSVTSLVEVSLSGCRVPSTPMKSWRGLDSVSWLPRWLLSSSWPKEPIRCMCGLLVSTSDTRESSMERTVLPSILRTERLLCLLFSKCDDPS